MDNEPTRVLARASRRPVDELPTVIRVSSPALIQAATPPRPRSVDLLQLAPDLQMRTFDPSKRIVPGVIRRDQNSEVKKAAPPQRSTAPTDNSTDNSTVIAEHPRRSARPQPPAAEEATVVWKEGVGNLVENFHSIVRQRLFGHKGKPRRLGLSKITWTLVIATATIVGYTTLHPPSPPVRPTSHPVDSAMAPQGLNAGQAGGMPEPSAEKPAAGRADPLDEAPSQLAGLERLAVDALLDGRLDTARRAYKELVANQPHSRAYALTLEIISSERAR